MSGLGLYATSVREMVIGCQMTLATCPPLHHTPRTCPHSCTACIPSQEAKTVEAISANWWRRGPGVIIKKTRSRQHQFSDFDLRTGFLGLLTQFLVSDSRYGIGVHLLGPEPGGEEMGQL